MRPLLLGLIPCGCVSVLAGCLSAAPAPTPVAADAPVAHSLVVAEAVPAAPPPKDSPTNPDGTASDGAKDRRLKRLYGYVSLGVGIEALAIAVPTSVILLHKKSDLDSQCDASKQCSENGVNVAHSLPALVGVNTVAWVVGVVGTAAGVVLLYTTRADGSKSTTVSVSPAGVSVGGTF